jgi:excisionase family DNA binding protein
LPPHLLDPVQIAYFFSIPLEEFNWYPGQGTIVPYANWRMHEDFTAFRRIEEKLDRTLSELHAERREIEYVSLKRAATLTGLSYSHVRRAVLTGELPASNVATASHPLYRIARTDLASWMEAKKGGSKVPPKAALNDLIDRHLPGLRGRNDSATR